MHDPKNRGLSNFTRGKKQNIPVPASMLSKGDSYSNLSLPSNPESPGKKFSAKMRIEERKFKQQFDQAGVDPNSRPSLED